MFKKVSALVDKKKKQSLLYVKKSALKQNLRLKSLGKIRNNKENFNRKARGFDGKKRMKRYILRKNSNKTGNIRRRRSWQKRWGKANRITWNEEFRTDG